jgi:RNA polymerase sigma-54 factor
MALEIKQSPKLVQQLVITPQLQQAIKLLQLTRVELVDLIQDEIKENPLLEVSELDDEEEPKGDHQPEELVQKEKTP